MFDTHGTPRTPYPQPDIRQLAGDNPGHYKLKTYHSLQHAGGLIEKYREANLSQVFADAMLQDRP